jgi:PAS domain S-box-containing protein
MELSNLKSKKMPTIEQIGQLLQAFDNISDCMMFSSTREVQTNMLRLNYVSDACENILGVPGDEALADIGNVLNRVHGDDLKIFWKYAENTLSVQKKFEVEVRYNHPVKGDNCWLRISSYPRLENNIMFSSGFIFDITAHKETEQNSLASEKAWMNALENMPDGTLFRTVRDMRTRIMRFDYVSGAFERVLGVSAEDAIADRMNVYRNVEPNDLKWLMHEMDIRLDPMKKLEVEVRYTHPVTKKEMWIQISSYPHMEGDYLVGNGFVFDITARKKNELELAKYRENLEQMVNQRTEELLALNNEMLKKNEVLTEEISARSKLIKKLEYNQNKLSSFISQAFDGIEMLDSEGRIIEWSKSMEHMIGVPSNEVLGRYNWEVQSYFLKEEEQNRNIQEHLRQYILGGSEQEPLFLEYAVGRNDEAHYLQTVTFPIKLHDTYYFGKILRDVTEQRLSEIELKRTNEELNTAVEEINSSNEELSSTNDELEKYRMQLELMVDEKTVQLVDEQQQLKAVSRRQAMIINVLQTVQSANNLQEAIDGILAEIGDYTGVSRAYVYEKTGDNMPPNSYGWCNVGVESFVEELINMHEIIINKLFEAFAEGRYLCTSDIHTFAPEVVRELERQNIMSIVVMPLIAGGVVSGFIGFDHCGIARKWEDDDVVVFKSIAQILSATVHRFHSEIELIRAKEKAEEADKLKSAFLANMSHEIRTPINGIAGFMSFVDDAALLPERRHSYVTIIRKNCAQLVSIIDDIIDIAKIESQQLKISPVTFDLNEVMTEVFFFFSSYLQANKKEKVDLVLDDSRFITPCIIYCDAIRLRQVITNLIGNASKFTDKGYISFGYQLLPPDKLEFWVEDTGIGLRAEQMEIIFERFRQAETDNHRKYGGTGLGLAISRSLVQMMGGNISVESVENEGATFRFTISYIPAELQRLA